MDAVTYGDRRRIVEKLAECASTAGSVDSTLVEQVFRMLAAPRHSNRHESAVDRGAMALCYSLLYSPNPPSRAEARAALRYLVLEADAIPDSQPERGLDDDVLILHRALGLVRAADGEAVGSLSHPHLDSSHAAAVEAKLKRHRDGPVWEPASLEGSIAQKLERLEASCPKTAVRDLSKNVQALLKVRAESSDTEVAAWSAAGLQCVADDTPAVTWGHQALAILEDWYATFLALDRCRAPSAALVRTLDYGAEGLPLVNMLALRDGEVRSLPSEYAVVNFAAARQLLESPSNTSRLIHVPVVGGTPLIVAVLAALYRIRQRQAELARLPQFNPGDLVQIIQGGTKAIGYFQGFEVRKGITGAVVKDDRVTAWYALTPVLLASMSKANKGKPAGLHKISANIDSLPVAPLDLLFEGTNPLRFELAGCEVLFVCSSMERCRHLLDTTTVLRTPLTELMPVGRPVVADEPVEGWSRRWHATPPVLAITSSLYEACNYLNTRGKDACRLVVVEDAARWVKSADLLMDLSTAAVPVLAFGSYADESDLGVYADFGFKQARWDIDELEQLNWDNEQPAISAVEARIAVGLRSLIHVEPVDSACMDLCGKALEAAGGQLAAAGGDAKAEVALGAAWSALTKASRWFLPMDVPDSPVEALNAAAEGLMGSRVQRFLKIEVTAALEHAARQLGMLADELRSGNPKWERFSAASKRADVLTLVVPGERAMQETRAGLDAMGLTGAYRLATPRELPESGVVTGGIVVPGWYRSDLMTRLMNPPIGPSIDLLLWGFERKHFERWKARKDQVHALPGMVETVGGTFRRKTRRTAIVVPPADTLPPAPEDVLQGLQMGIVRSTARRAGESSANGLQASELVDAVVVSFKEGMFAFFEQYGSAQVVTDVLRSPPEEASNVRVRYKPVDELSDGDLVLFHTGSEADAIRAQADALIEAEKPGSARVVRQHAVIWKDALVRYRDSHNLSAVEVAGRLARAGCKRNVMTVRKWLTDETLIGPQSYATEVEQVLKLTGDAELKSGLARCVSAIRYLRGKHLQASTALARTLLHQAGHQVRKTTGDFGAGLVVAEVNLVDTATVRVARRALHRLNRVEAF